MIRFLQTAAWVIGGIVVYELIRGSLVRRLSRRMHRAGDRYVEDREIHLDTYKFAGRHYVKTEVLNDAKLNESIVASAKETGKPVESVRADVEKWLDEIVPQFNTWAYYRFGFVISRMALNFIFEVIVDEFSLKRARAKIQPGAAVVYVFNHRSNADFILVSYALASSIALSYAVGEWARVWPLDALFRRFGAYFVRRGFRNPLYHLVLARYIQLIVKRGVTQGVFPEGGLSRDGALREPKLGILEYIAQLKADPTFQRDVVFVPVGINYDRVLEDASLLAEAKGGGKLGSDSIASRIATLWAILKKLPVTLVTNSLAAAAGRTGRYGYAGVSFGDPVSLSSYLSALHEDVFALPQEERRERIRGFATILMSEIARLVPVTPATCVAEVIARSKQDTFAENDLRILVQERLVDLRAAGRRIAQGREFAPMQAGWVRLSDVADRRAELLEEEKGMVAAEEAELTTRLGVDLLARRRAVRVQATPSGRTVSVGDRDLLRFYARSLDRSA